jgi:hypothetical protein
MRPRIKPPRRKKDCGNGIGEKPSAMAGIARHGQRAITVEDGALKSNGQQPQKRARTPRKI